MASRKTQTIESDIYDITESNIAEKLKEHVGEVIQELKDKKYKDVKIVTKIKQLTPSIAVAISNIEELKKLLDD